MSESEGTDRLSLDSRISDNGMNILAPNDDGSSPRRSSHLEIYVAELEKELFACKEQCEKERALRREAEKEVQFLRIQLNRLSEKRVRFHNGPHSNASDRDSQMREEFQTFSAMIDNRLQRFDSRELCKQEDLKDRVNLIQNFSVFGVPEELLFQGQKDSVEGRVVTSLRPVNAVDEQAARMVFPSGALIKRIYGEKIFQKSTEIITKSYSKENSFVIGFESQSPGGLKSNPETDVLLNILNPQRRLFCLCVGTYDFTYCGSLDPLETSNISMVLEEKSVFDPRMTTSEIVHKHSSQNMPDEIAVSQRVYCISSYFPFFSFFEDLVLLLLNTLKVERLEIYSEKLEGLAQADSRYHSMRIKQLFEQKMRRINTRAIIPNMVYQVRLTNDTLTLRTNLDRLEYSFLEECLYQILSVFTLDTFMEVLTLCLLEEKVVFVCDNSHILTFTVYMFVNLLMRPLVYAFATVYILPSEEFLSVPFPVIYGLLKKKKWFEQNRIMEHFKNTYVFLNPIGVHVEYTENRKELVKARPDKLRTMLSPFFKDIEKSRKMWATRSSNYHIELNEYVQHSTAEERRTCVSILQTVKKFLKEEVLDYIPSKARIAEIKIDALRFPIPKLKDEHTHVIGYLVKAIKEQRKSKDTFFERVLHTQMMSMYFSALV